MTEQNPFGPHIMDAHVNLANAWVYLEEARPASTLWFNNHGGAQECKRRYPWMHVVHRQVNDNQQKWHEVTTPEQWYAEHKVFGANGVIIQCYNEPGGDFRNNAEYRNAVIDFMLGVWRLGARDGVAIGGPTFPTGNPHESRIVDGSFDRMIIEACSNPFAWMLFHEYWHTDPVAEYPWMVGRHEFWYDRADTIGLKLTRVLLTEYGMDKGGGVDDGYLNQGISGQAYGQQNIRSRTVLERKPPVNIFAFGKGYGWWSFDMDNDEVKNEIKGYRETVEDTVDIVYTEGYVVSVPQTWVNVRREPSTSADIVDQVGVGERVNYADKFAEADGYRWQELDIGWVTVWNMSRNTAMAVLAPYTVPALEFGMPMEWEYLITGYFKEPRDTGPHEGVDFVPYWGVGVGAIDVLSVAEGVVESVRTYEQSQAQGKLTTGYGNYIRVRYEDRDTVYKVWYCHLFHVYAKLGAPVFRGQVIGTIGSTGNSTAEHLHITVQQEGAGETLAGLPNVVNPAVILDELA